MTTTASAQRTVFVSGASSGLGEAIAKTWLDRGYQVWGTARSATRLKTFSGHAGFHPIELDLQDRAEALATYEKAETDAGGFTVVVNNAGFGIFGALTEISQPEWDRQLESMLGNTFALIRRQVELLLERDRGATLVNVSSLAVDFPLPFMTGYNVTKAGLSALSESLLMELSCSPIRVIDFRPGDLRTEFNTAMQPPSHPSEGPSERRGNMDSAWRILQQNLDQSPVPKVAAETLWQAVAKEKRGTITAGGWFQAKLAPALIGMIPQGLARTIRWRYFGIR